MNKPYQIKRLAIVGAGPSGLSTAYFLRNKSIAHIDLFESTDHIGGLAKSFKLWGRDVELGAHFLAYDECKATKLIISDIFQEKEPIFYTRKAYIQMMSTKFSYPPKIKDIVQNLNYKQLQRLIFSYVRAKINGKHPANAKEGLVNNYGSFLYDFFFRDYSFKLWGKSCEELDLCYYQSMLPFRRANIVSPILRTKKQKVVHFQGGMQELWQRIYENCMVHGIKIHFNSRISLFRKKNDSIDIQFNDGTCANYDYIISTLPNHQNRKLFNLSTQQIYNFRDLVLVYLKVDQRHVLKGQCTYVYTKEVRAIRVIDFSHFPNVVGLPNILLFEYWVDTNTPSYQSDEFITNMVKADFEAMNLNFSYQDIFIRRIPKAYRIPELGTLQKLSKEKKDLDARFLSIGRSNSPFFNYGMDNAIAEAHEISKMFQR